MRRGDVVADRYELEELAGSGGMGAVWRARDRLGGELVALKLLHARDPGLADRLAREAQVLAELRHPGIVRYVAHGTTAASGPWLATEWLDGQTLADLISTESLTRSQSLELCRRVAEALAVAHARSVVHRDLKPANLFLPSGDVTRPKILDFGIARVAGPALTLTGTMLGTPGYMAPEQARGQPDVDARADVFALGCVLFRCLAGRAPFEADDPMSILLKVVLEAPPRLRDLNPTLPQDLDGLVARMLEKAPDARPASAAQVVAEIAQLSPSATMPLDQPPASRHLTSNERQAMTLLLARPSGPALERRSSELETVATSEHDAILRALALAADEAGEHLEVLADGTAVLTFVEGAATDVAARAARCALALRRSNWASIAIVTGRGVLDRALPIGEIIERGSRLVRLGEARAVRVDEVTAHLLEARFELEADGVGLLLRSEQSATAERMLLGRPTPCVGRDRELAMLDAIVTECIAEPGATAVLVTGAPGLGKSRLCFEFLRAARERAPGLEIWSGRGDSMRAGSPFGLVAQSLRGAAGILDGEPLAVRRDKLRRRVARHVAAADVDRVTRFLGELVGSAFAADDAGIELAAARRDAVLMADHVRRAWEDLIAAECAAHPVLLVLEDLHWGDLPTLELVQSTLLTVADRPFMVLALARPEVHEAFPKLWARCAVQEIRLGALTRKGSVRLVREVLAKDATEAQVEAIVERAGGNAFYLEELIRAVAEGRGDRLPETVLAMAQSRLERLDAEARAVLRAASVFGQTFWASGVAALLGRELRAQLRSWLQILADSELITRSRASRFPGEEEFAFRHALVQEAAYGMLVDADRTLGHALAGGWLEQVGESEPVVLAEHFERGCEHSRAIGAWERAAAQALDANDSDAVVARVARGVACGATGEVLARLRLTEAQALRWLSKKHEAQSAALSAKELLPPSSDLWHDAIGLAAIASASAGDSQTLLDLHRDLDADIREPSAARITAIARVAQQLLLAGRGDLAESLFRRVPDDVPENDPVTAAAVQHARGTLASFAGDQGRQVELAVGRCAMLERVGDRRNLCVARGSLGYSYQRMGQFELAREILSDVVAMAERLGLRQTASHATHNLGLVLSRLGHHDEALEVEERAVAGFIEDGDARMVGAGRTYVATILLASGRPEGAEEEALRAVEIAAQSPPTRALAWAVVGDARLARGDPAGALAAATEAMDLIRSIGDAIEEGYTLACLVHARALGEAGAHEASAAIAAQESRRLVARAERITNPLWRRSFLERVPENVAMLALAAGSATPLGDGRTPGE